MVKDNAVVWKEFRIGDLFDCITGNTDIKKEHINGKGINVVSSGLENYGIIGKTDVDARVVAGNAITVDMFGNVFYRADKYKMVTHARVFTLLPKGFVLNETLGLYICTTLKWLSAVYSFSNMCSFNKIKNEVIFLPAVKKIVPNFDKLLSVVDKWTVGGGYSI